MISEVWFLSRLRVRYQETDQMGVVYHANYLNWFEISRTEYIRELGIPYRGLEEQGLLLPVIDAELHFEQPARYDDILNLYVRVTHFSPIRMEFEVQISRALDEAAQLSERRFISADTPIEGELLVSGKTKHVWLNRSWKPARIDKAYPELYHLLQKL